MSKESTTTTYELPDFLVEADDMFSSEHPINKAMLHVKSLAAQCYALKLLAPFDENPDLVSMRISVEGDGYLNLIEHEQEDGGDDLEEDLEGYLEDLNDARDDELLSFISSVFSEEITRDNVHEQISVAYSRYCHGADWKKIFERRQAFLDARKLSEGTEGPSTTATSTRPRM